MLQNKTNSETKKKETQKNRSILQDQKIKEKMRMTKFAGDSL